MLGITHKQTDLTVTIHSGGTANPTFVEGQDYFNSAPPFAYKPYTYPHPLVEAQERKVQEQAAAATKLESTVTKQTDMIAEQQKQTKALTATVQKVSEKLELAKAAPQLVTNP